MNKFFVPAIHTILDRLSLSCWLVGLLALGWLIAASSEGYAQVAPPEIGTWPLETMHLHNGETYRGLATESSEGYWNFTEVVQPAGRPMYLIIRPIEEEAIETYEPLSDDQRDILADRIARYRHRLRIELGRMNRIRLTRTTWDTTECYRYQGSLFTLISSANEETTRRCIVRIEQIFLAFKQFFPPQFKPDESLTIVIFGSVDTYRTYLAHYEIDLENPAFYSPSENLIVAGSNLDTFSQLLSRVQSTNRNVLQQLEEINENMPNQLHWLATNLRNSGYSNDAIADEIAARRRTWEAEYAAKQLEVAVSNSRNEDQFAAIAQQMFRRLYHEAFHAYLNMYVYPDNQFEVPVWLQEGLAQVFENAQLDSGLLRIDAPLSEAHQRLLSDLRSADSLQLDQLLLATHEDFLITDQNRETAKVFYAHAWGVAYYLLILRSELSVEETLEFLSSDDPYTIIERFERMVGSPLGPFEERWRTAIEAI